jgi:hypothetical protein
LNDNSLIIKAQTALNHGSTLKVYNANGQLVYNRVYASAQLQIDENIPSSNWQPGIYLVHVENGQGLVFKKKLTLVK